MFMCWFKISHFYSLNFLFVTQVLGENWKMALVNPWAKSRLPHNGVEWDTANTWQLEGPKTR
jgi:hypothetical protein